MEVAELRRLRSRSFDAASPIMPSRSVLSPVSPSGGAGSDADSTEIESPTPGNLRSRSTSTDSPPPARLWKSIGIVRNLFRSRVRTPSAPAEDTFFLWDELPEAVRYAVTSFLSVRDVLSIAAVSREAYMFARSDAMWRPLFMKRFQGAEGVVFTLANEDFFNEYCERLIDPKPGDSVEVAWEGTFNLLANEKVTTFEGRAWWSASIVACEGDRYRIHYPQWEASVWDESVARHRIRWPSKNTDVKCNIRRGDIVEYKCESSHGISPWLEALVTDTHPEHGFRLADVIRSDPKRYVKRETLRLIYRPRGRLLGRLLHRPAAPSKCAIM